MSIKTDTADAVKIIAVAAAEASKTIANAAAEALKVRKEENGGDHDLIIQINTKLGQIQEDVTLLKNQDKQNVTQEQHQAVCTKADDHEVRIRSNETNITKIMTYGTAGVILLGIIEFVLNKYF